MSANPIPWNNFWLWGTWDKRIIKAPCLAQRVAGEVCKVALGQTCIVALLADGSLISWGEDSLGCLGLGSGTTISLEPQEITLSDCSDDKVVDVQCGRRHVLALTTKGKVYAWGDNTSGQLGLGEDASTSVLAPELVSGLESDEAAQVLAFGDMSYALMRESGRVFAWGSNADGLLGIESEVAGVSRPTVMLRMQHLPIQRMELIGSGGTVVGYIGQTKGSGNPRGSFWLWGRWGRRVCLAPLLVKKVDAAIQQVVVASSFIVALTSEGEILSWGEDPSGCLGLGHRTTIAAEPQRVDFASSSEGRIVDVQLGRGHVLALSENGKVFTWGSHKDAANPGIRCAYEPLLVQELCQHRIVQILAASSWSYALTEDGEVFAWRNTDDSDGILRLEHKSSDASRPILLEAMKGTRVSRIEAVPARDNCEKWLVIAYVSPNGGQQRVAKYIWPERPDIAEDDWNFLEDPQRGRWQVVDGAHVFPDGHVAAAATLPSLEGVVASHLIQDYMLPTEGIICWKPSDSQKAQELSASVKAKEAEMRARQRAGKHAGGTVESLGSCLAWLCGDTTLTPVDRTRSVDCVLPAEALCRMRLKSATLKGDTAPWLDLSRETRLEATIDGSLLFPGDGGGTEGTKDVNKREAAHSSANSWTLDFAAVVILEVVTKRARCLGLDFETRLDRNGDPVAGIWLPVGDIAQDVERLLGERLRMAFPEPGDCQ